MATVYLAVDRRLDREVALKVMHPHLAEGSGGQDFVARFRREARTAARLAHPGLVAVFDQGVDGETSYLTMEYVDGINLRRKITDLGALPLGEALAVAEKILDALSTAHRAGLVHRDIKPENVLIATDGRVKLADFGLARAVTEVTSTTTGTVLGTVAYLAPELVTHGESDARTDVYACGVLLYEMITGSQPFVGTTPIHVAFQHVNNDVPQPSDAVPWLPVEIDDLVRALAARDRDERVADAGAALTLLRRVRAGLDPADLERRADVPGAPPPADLEPDAEGATDPEEQETTRFQTRSGATVALPIGLGLPAAGEVVEVEPRAPRRRRGALVWTTVLVLLAALGFAGWWFGAGPGSPTSVPAIAGATSDQATEALRQAHLVGTFTEAFDATQPAGLVVSTTPEVGTQVARNSTVTVVISKGPDWVPIPADLVGMTSDAATAALTAAGLTPSVAAHQNDDRAKAGTVLSASLPDGSAATPDAKATRGTTVGLVISDGPAPVVIATISGMTVDQATALLAKDALTLATTQEYSDTVAAGVIISQDPPPSTTMHRGDTVNAVVSKGPELVDVPTVPYGAAVADATTLLESAGFKVKVEKASPFLHLNRVIGQTPSNGQAPKGSTITLTIT